VKSGETDYERLIRPIEERMVRSIWRIVRDPDRADDTLQDALATVWRRLDRIRRHPNPTALILRICANSAYDALRRRRVRQADPLPAGLADAAPSAMDQAAAEELRDEVVAAVARLPRKQALAVLMRVVQERDYAEIAAALGCSEQTARSHAAKGRARLREVLVRYAPYVQGEGNR
jgi:RNA polymerase sigma factor (sigma-70 family)